MSIVIGQGETKNLIYEITDKNNVFSSEDILLFAIKNIDGNVIFKKEELVENLSHENDTYVFTVKLSSDLTASFHLGIERYTYDLTLIKGEDKKPLTNVKTIDVIETVGASISEG